MDVPYCYLGERACRWVGLPRVVGSPTLDSPIFPHAAAVAPSDVSVGEPPARGCQVDGLVDFVGCGFTAPADSGSVGA